MSVHRQMRQHEPLSSITLTWIVVGAVLVRALWALFVPVVPISDSEAYDRFARTLVEHGVFGWTAQHPFAFWPPGTSFLYAVIYRLTGFRYEGIVVLNLLLSVVMIVCSARVAGRWFGSKAAVATAGILAVWPTLVLFTTVLASELPYLALTAGALDLWTSPSRRWYASAAGAGLLLGYAALVRSQALALPAVMGLGLWLWSGSRRDELWRQCRLAAVAALTMSLVVAPWTLRNYRLYGAPVLVSTNGGITLWMGNSPGSKGDFASIPARLHGLSDYEQSQVLGAEAKAYIMGDPSGFLVRTGKKLAYLYANESIGVTWNAQGIGSVFGDEALLWLKRFTQVTWAAILLLACAGLWQMARAEGWGRALFSPVVLAIAYYSIVHSVVVSQDRYHLAFASQLAMLGACAVAAWSSRRPSLAAASSQASIGAVS